MQVNREASLKEHERLREVDEVMARGSGRSMRYLKTSNGTDMERPISVILPWHRTDRLRWYYLIGLSMRAAPAEAPTNSTPYLLFSFVQPLVPFDLSCENSEFGVTGLTFGS